MEIPLEEFQRVILESNPVERENILQEIVQKYQVMYVKVLGKLYELLGEEEYHRIMDNKEMKKEIKEVKKEVKEVKQEIKEVKEEMKAQEKAQEIKTQEIKEEIKAEIKSQSQVPTQPPETNVQTRPALSSRLDSEGFIQELPGTRPAQPSEPFNGNAYSYHKELRFCKVRSKEKKPFETDWVNKPYTWDEIQDHIKKSINFGVLCGYGGLIVIDCDDKKFADAIAGDLPKTFSVRTGGGGVHYYFFCPELAEKKIVLKNGKEHYGEMQAKGAQVVAAGSDHPNGRKYEVLTQFPISTMSRENILEVLKPYMQEVNEEEKKAIEYNKEFLGDDIGSLPISNVISITGFRRLHSGEYQGKNPWHGSSGGINFNVNLAKNIAFCWRCNAGISVVQAIAMNEGIITNCSDEVRGDKFLRVKDIAKQKYGYVDKRIYATIEDEELNEEERELIVKVLEMIILKKKDEATELIVDYIKEKNNIYSTIDDKQSEIWFYDGGVYKPNGITKIEEISRKILRKAYAPQLATRIVEKIRTDTLIEKENFFKNESTWEIPIQNGIFNLLTKELKPFDPKRIFFNKLPVYYDPEAKCPAIDQHFKDVLTHESDSSVMYEIIGFLLVKDYFIEKAIMMVGGGRNGKGKTIDLIKRFLGMDNCASIPLTALTEDSFRISELFGKMANLAGDLSSTALKDTSLFKQTTGRDLIGAKRKFLTDIKFMNYAKHIFACNELPRVYDFSKGFWERWVLLEFPYEFVNEKEFNKVQERVRIEKKLKLMDPTHIDKISKQEELNGLFNKALEGLQRVITQKDFSYSRGSSDIKLFWMRRADAFLAFCYDHVEADKDNMVFKPVLRKEFFEYCKKHNLKGVSDMNIKIVLEEMFGVTELRKNIDGEYKHAWVGIKFKNLPAYTLKTD